MCGSARLTIDASMKSRNATAHSSANVSLPRRVARKDGWGATGAIWGDLRLRFALLSQSFVSRIIVRAQKCANIHTDGNEPVHPRRGRRVRRSALLPAVARVA